MLFSPPVWHRDSGSLYLGSARSYVGLHYRAYITVVDVLLSDLIMPGHCSEVPFLSMNVCGVRSLIMATCKYEVKGGTGLIGYLMDIVHTNYFVAVVSC